MRILPIIVALLFPTAPLWAQMEHVMFITSNSYSINSAANPAPIGNTFGGLAAADQLCNSSGQSEFLIGKYGPQTFKALLSDGSTNARDRVPIAGRVVNAHDQVLATDFDDLWDGRINIGIRYDELGSFPAGTIFWSGSQQNGFASQHAQNWSLSSQVAGHGTSLSTLDWFGHGIVSGSGAFRFACLCEARVIGPGDFNDDGQVDAADYVVWRQTIDTTVDRGVGADGNGDGTVTSADLEVWQANFGNSYAVGSGSAQSAVPEPSALLLLCCGALALSSVRFGRITTSPHDR